jgi:hypothetical protein
MPKLTVELVQSKTCFVTLPSTFFSASTSHSQLPVVLRVEWTTTIAGSSVAARQRAYVGWMGAISASTSSRSALGVPGAFAASLEIPVGSQVDVEPVGHGGPVKRVNVIPHTPDDWEISN